MYPTVYMGTGVLITIRLFYWGLSYFIWLFQSLQRVLPMAEKVILYNTPNLPNYLFLIIYYQSQTALPQK